MRDKAAPVASSSTRLSVVIPIRNRGGIRLENCLRSLRWQSVDADEVELILSDFGSDADSLASIRRAAEAHDAKLVHTPTSETWNRARALNIGIQRTRGQTILCTDADMVFAEDFLATILEVHDERPQTMIHCGCHDLPDDVPEQHWSLDDLDELHAQATRRPTRGTGACQAAPREFFFDVRGYDERFRFWGYEDLDMTSRAACYGLEVEWISERTFMLHQWHPSVKLDRNLQRRINRWRYMLTRQVVQKNRSGWGLEGRVSSS